MACVQFFLFFFFQAEDGIRDLYVTGVQTCALPISVAAEASPEISWPRRVQRLVLGWHSSYGNFLLCVADTFVVATDQLCDPRVSPEQCGGNARRKIYFERRSECGPLGWSRARLHWRDARVSGQHPASLTSTASCRQAPTADLYKRICLPTWPVRMLRQTFPSKPFALPIAR